MKNTEQKIPALRFPEFSGEWEEKRLRDIIISQKLGGNYTNTEASNNNPLIKMGNLDRGFIKLDKIEYIKDGEIIDENDLLKYGDLLFNTRNTLELVGKVAIWKGELDRAYYNSNILRLEFGNNFFMNALFNTSLGLKALRRLATGTTSVAAIYTNDLIKLEVLLPSLPEQQKIADFLSAVDKRLQLLKDKKTKLEEYKRGVMQRIFSQELRFTRPDGSAYPDWEEKRLGELGTTYNGLSGKTAEDFGEGKPYIQYKQIFDNSKIDMNKCGFVNIVNGEKQNEVAYGDVLFTTSSETPHEVGFSSIILDEVKNTYLNSFCFGFRPNSLTELYPSFSRYLFRSEIVRKDIITLAQGSTRYNMSKIEFLKISTFIPCLDEQRQIADFLSAIDNKISLLSKQIQSTEQYKKGLLQQMFV